MDAQIEFQPMPLEIIDGWYVEDLKTKDDCSRARSILLEQSMDIELQLKAANIKRIETGEYADPHWYKRASTALRLKKRALQRVQDLQGQLRKVEKQALQESADRRLLNIIKDMFPVVFSKAVEELQRRMGGWLE